jgi:hypothetical protein
MGCIGMRGTNSHPPNIVGKIGSKMGYGMKDGGNSTMLIINR